MNRSTQHTYRPPTPPTIHHSNLSTYLPSNSRVVAGNTTQPKPTPQTLAPAPAPAPAPRRAEQSPPRPKTSSCNTRPAFHTCQSHRRLRGPGLELRCAVSQQAALGSVLQSARACCAYAERKRGRETERVRERGEWVVQKILDSTSGLRGVAPLCRDTLCGTCSPGRGASARHVGLHLPRGCVLAVGTTLRCSSMPGG
jgi:hypothetical protein